MLPLIAVDIGNSRVKFGAFAPSSAEPLPAPTATLELASHDEHFAKRLAAWLADEELPAARWSVASVNRQVRQQLVDWLAVERPTDEVVPLTFRELPLEILLAEPERVGLDRLLGAVAANALRGAEQPAVVVDLGSAITVDLVSETGAFMGGAILPGIGMAARALHEQTDQLPLVPMAELHEPPPALGTATISAIQAGLYWGAVGAVRELVHRLTADAAQRPLVLLTGGAAPLVAQLVEPDARHESHLVLAGIALALRAQSAR